MAPDTPKVTALTVARLHNLGNYEHVRYEVTVAVPDAASTGAVLADVTAMLDDLRPNKTSAYELKHARDILAQPVPEAAGQEEADLIHSRREHAQRLVDRNDAEERRIARARAAFDDIGGAKRYTDAKDKWDDEDHF